MKIRPIGIRTRLTLTYVLLFAAILSAFGVASYTFLKSRLDSALTEELNERAAGLRGYLRFTSGGVMLAYNSNDPDEAYFVKVATRYYQIYDARTGVLLTQSPELEFMGLEFTPEEVEVFLHGPLSYDVQTDQGKLRFRNEVIQAPDGETYLFQIGLSMADMDETLGNFFELLLWLIPAGIALTVAAGLWASGRALRPLSALAAAAGEFGLTHLDKRLPVSGSGDELDRFSGAFNDALARLERAIGEMRQFTASISHELRTPLSILRGEAEIALMDSKSEEDYRRVLSSQLEEFEKLTRMINQLLTLAQAESGEIKLDHVHLDLASLVRTLGEQMTPVAESKGVHLHVESPPAAVVMCGDANWMERIILNLLDNAIKFTPEGGSVTVSASSIASGALLTVTDTGCGIPDESLPRIFERFYQVDPARSSSGPEGVGLGLSLVKWAVTQHGGTIDVRSESGRGTSFRIVLPKD